MAYVKHTYSSGDILTADNMNHIEDGLYAVTNTANAALTRSVGVVVDDNQYFTSTEKQRARTNIGAAHISVNDTTLVIS